MSLMRAVKFKAPSSRAAPTTTKKKKKIVIVNNAREPKVQTSKEEEHLRISETFQFQPRENGKAHRRRRSSAQKKNATRNKSRASPYREKIKSASTARPIYISAELPD